MRVTPPDLELWLTGYVRRLAAAEGIDLVVSNKEPHDLQLPVTRPVVVVRDDSGAPLDWTVFDRYVGVSVLAGTRLHDAPAKELARWLSAVLFDDGLPLVESSPIASVEWSGCNGPYSVPENLDVTRMYFTAQYVVSGSW